MARAALHPSYGFGLVRWVTRARRLGSGHGRAALHPSYAILPGGHRVRGDGVVPAAADGADQGYRRAGLFAAQLYGNALLQQHAAVGFDHVQVADATFAILR